jgi:hypothetical protein
MLALGNYSLGSNIHEVIGYKRIRLSSLNRYLLLLGCAFEFNV